MLKKFISQSQMMIVDVVCVTVRHNFHFSTAFRVVWVSFYLSFLSFASRAHISNVEIVTLKLHYSVATQQFFFSLHSSLPLCVVVSFFRARANKHQNATTKQSSTDSRHCHHHHESNIMSDYEYYSIYFLLLILFNSFNFIFFTLQFMQFKFIHNSLCFHKPFSRFEYMFIWESWDHETFLTTLPLIIFYYANKLKTEEYWGLVTIHIQRFCTLKVSCACGRHETHERTIFHAPEWQRNIVVVAGIWKMKQEIFHLKWVN